MPRLLPISVAIRTLKRKPLPERCRISDETAVEWLRSVSGQDFGFDTAAWTGWLRQNRWAYYRVPELNSVLDSRGTNLNFMLHLHINGHGCPTLEIPDGSKIEVEVSHGQKFADGTEEMRDVFISGNQAGLRTLAHFILAVSECEVSGFHPHLGLESEA